MPNITLLPSIAAVAAAASAALTNVVTPSGDVYRDDVQELSHHAIEQHALLAFNQIDADKDDNISQDEFTASAIARQGLAHLNGFIPIETQAGVQKIALPFDGREVRVERDHVAYGAQRQFARFDSADGQLSEDEFKHIYRVRFSLADLDDDGVLAGVELTRFALAEVGAETILANLQGF
ncbi:MAG: hypothetical protein AAF850_01950 [Pseudomonadota bacterium]